MKKRSEPRYMMARYSGPQHVHRETQLVPLRSSREQAKRAASAFSRSYSAELIQLTFDGKVLAHFRNGAEVPVTTPEQ